MKQGGQLKCRNYLFSFFFAIQTSANQRRASIHQCIHILGDHRIHISHPTQFSRIRLCFTLALNIRDPHQRKESFQIIDILFCNTNCPLLPFVLFGFIRFCEHLFLTLLCSLVTLLDTLPFLGWRFSIQDKDRFDSERQIMNGLVKETNDMTDDLPFTIPQILSIRPNMR